MDTSVNNMIAQVKSGFSQRLEMRQHHRVWALIVVVAFLFLWVSAGLTDLERGHGAFIDQVGLLTFVTVTLFALVLGWIVASGRRTTAALLTLAGLGGLAGAGFAAQSTHAIGFILAPLVVGCLFLGRSANLAYRTRIARAPSPQEHLDFLLFTGWAGWSLLSMDLVTSLRTAALLLAIHWLVPSIRRVRDGWAPWLERVLSGRSKHDPAPLPAAAMPIHDSGADPSDDPIADTICKVITNNIKYEEWANPVVLKRDVFRGPQFDTYILRPPQNIKARRIQELAGIIERETQRPNAIIGDSAEDGGITVQISKPTKSHWVIWYSDLMARQDVQALLKDHPGGVIAGVDARNRPVLMDVASEDDPHTLVAGMTGSGKSIMIHNIIVTLLSRNSPRDLQLVFIDPKIVTGALYSKVPHLWAPVIEDISEVPSLLEQLDVEQTRRNNLLKADGVTKAREYNRRHPDDPMSLLLVVIDEVTDLGDASDTALAKAYSEHVSSLARKGRSVNIRLVLGVQRPSTKNVGFLRGQITRRIVMRLRDLGESAMAMQVEGDDSATRLLGKGDTLLISSTGPMVRVKAPLLPEEQMPQRPDEMVQNNIAAIIAKWGTNEYATQKAARDAERERLEAQRTLVAAQHSDEIDNRTWFILLGAEQAFAHVEDPLLDEPLDAGAVAAAAQSVAGDYPLEQPIDAAEALDVLKKHGLLSGSERTGYTVVADNLRRQIARFRVRSGTDGRPGRLVDDVLSRPTKR